MHHAGRLTREPLVGGGGRGLGGAEGGVAHRRRRRLLRHAVEEPGGRARRRPPYITHPNHGCNANDCRQNKGWGRERGAVKTGSELASGRWYPRGWGMRTKWERVK